MLNYTFAIEVILEDHAKGLVPKYAHCIPNTLNPLHVSITEHNPTAFAFDVFEERLLLNIGYFTDFCTKATVIHVFINYFIIDEY